jgi:hypothetical protein
MKRETRGLRSAEDTLRPKGPLGPLGPGEERRTRARAPFGFRSPDARASAGHADAFFYLKGVQLSATHGAAAAVAVAAAGPPDSSRIVEETSGHATLLLADKYARQQPCCLSSAPRDP